MSFFMMPNGAAFQQSNVAYPFRYESEYQQPDFSYPFLVNPNRNYPKQQESAVPFKVYIFNGKFDKLSNASNVLRFEIDNKFSSFDKVLREHSIDFRAYDLHYVDDEHDLVQLSTEKDFQFMIKLMKGQLTKVILEKKVSVQKQPIARAIPTQIPQQQGLQFAFGCPIERCSKKDNLENILEKAFNSAFEPNVWSIPQPTQQSVQQPRRETPKTIEITFSIPKQQAEKKEEQKDGKSAQSFRDLLIQKLRERHAQEKKQESEEKKQVETPVPKTEEKKEVETEHAVNIVEPETVQTTPVEETTVVQEQAITEPITQDSTPIDNQSYQTQEVSQQDLENQDPIIESVVEEEQVVKTTIPHKYQKQLKLLHEMGFSNHIENIKLLNKNEGDLDQTIADLIHH